MSIFTATTTASRLVWKSPDGAREIFEVVLDVAGQPMKVNTYSEIISVVGWAGELESYEKPGSGTKPAQTFVKQAPKVDGYAAGSVSEGVTRGAVPARPSYVPKDDKAIKAMFAIKAACVITPTPPTETPLASYMANIEAHAQELFLMVDRVKASEDAPEAFVGEPAPEMPADFLKKEDPWPN